jgi:hypothetical protein
MIKLMDHCYKKWLTTFVYGEKNHSTVILDECFAKIINGGIMELAIYPLSPDGGRHRVRGNSISFPLPLINNVYGV